MSNLVSNYRCCVDNNQKIVTRVYNWDGREIRIDLCEKHRQDPDFSNFVSEYRKEEIVI